MDECVFCDIVEDREPAFRVVEDETTVAFLDVNAIADGHTLVVPKRHVETLTDADAETVAATFRTVRRVAAAIRSAVDPDGISVFQSNGRAAGQDVFHLHAHVVPRWDDDDISLSPARSRLDETTGRRIAETLADHLD